MKELWERGKFGAWLYVTRDALDLSAEQVVEMLPSQPTPPTLRKMEGGTKPSRRLRRDITALYKRLAAEKGITIEPPPVDDEGDTNDPKRVTALLEALSEQAELSKKILEATERQMSALEAQNREMWTMLRQLAEVQMGAASDEVAQLARELAEGQLGAGPLASEPEQSLAADGHGSPEAAPDQ